MPYVYNPFINNLDYTPLTSSSGGAVTNPNQPAFSYYNSIERSNVTGDGTLYRLIFDTALPGFTQQGIGWDGISTFTAPVGGVYLFNLQVFLDNVGAQTEAYTSITYTGVTTYYGEVINPSSAAVGNILSLNQTAMIKMNAGETVTAEVIVSGGSKTIGINLALADTYFQGILLV